MIKLFFESFPWQTKRTKDRWYYIQKRTDVAYTRIKVNREDRLSRAKQLGAYKEGKTAGGFTYFMATLTGKSIEVMYCHIHIADEGDQEAVDHDST